MTQSSGNNLPASQERILEETRLKIAIARQHLNALGKFGLTAEWIDQLEATADRVEAMPAYTDQLNQQKLLTAQKDAALVDYTEWGRTLRLRMELAFGRNSTEFSQFPAQRFRDSERNESKAILLIPTLLRVMQQYGQKLATVGYTQADLDEGEAIQARLKATNEAQEEYKAVRTTVSSQRRQIYGELVTGVQRINQIGQAVYRSDDPNHKLFRSNWGSGTSRDDEVEVSEDTEVDQV